MWARLARSALSGTAATVGGATVGCCLAIYVEKAAHRALFTYFPHKYAEVDHASGIEDWELEAARQATYASEMLPVTVHDKTEKRSERVFDATEFQAEEAAVKQTVPPRYGITVSDKTVFTCALTS